MPVMKSAILAIALLMTSACGQPEPLRTASDSCLIFRRISTEPAPAANRDDPGNQWDSDQTVFEVLQHNAAYDVACPNPKPPQPK